MTSRQPTQRVKDAETPCWVNLAESGQKQNALNLGTGFSEDPVPQFLVDILKGIALHPERNDYHQYTGTFGHPRLLNILAKMYGDHYGRELNAKNEVFATVGAFMALYYIYMGWIGPGDEVLVLEPTFDCSLQQILMAEGKPVSVPLRLKENATSSDDFELDMDLLEAKCTERAKILLLTNPGNPTGKVFTLDELNKIAEFAKRKDLIVIADEVYEYHVFGDDKKMIRFATLPDMYERTISVGSAGKALSITGWRVGWMIGPDRLLEPARQIHYFSQFKGLSPTQEAVAQALEIEFNLMKTNPIASYLLSTVPKDMRIKRDKMIKELHNAGFRVIVPDGGYFIMADINNKKGVFSTPTQLDNDPLLDYRFCRWLVNEKKLLCLPASSYYSPESRAGRDTMFRICYVKKDDNIVKTGSILKSV